MKPLFTSLLLATTLSGNDWNFSGSIENTLWVANDVPAALLEFDEGVLYDPRASFNIDYQPNSQFFLHSKFRADQGFDPGTRSQIEFRLDEFILRFRPFGDETLTIQAGKAPTIVGNWVPTHDYYDDPFLIAPLPYAAINGVNVTNVNEHSEQAIETRSNLPSPNIHNNKENWSSIIWGPAYSNGIALFGNLQRFDYAFEVKNTFLGSQPEEWQFGEGDFAEPTYSGRIGFRPDAAWALGLSASRGPYLNASDSDGFAPGDDRSDFHQTLLGFDLRWAHRDWIVSGETFFAHYNTTHEDLKTFSYYLQARYKAAPGFWIASRFGQTLSNEVSIPSGGEAPWSPDLLRAELAAGWRITPDLLLKSQYTYTLVTNGLSAPSKNLFALSLGWRF